MSSTHRFRRQFAQRIASAVGLSALVLPVLYACGDTIIIEGGGGAGATSSSNGSTTPSSSQAGVGGSTATNTTVSSGTSMCTESTTTAGGGPQIFHYSICLDDVNMPCPTDEMAADQPIRQLLGDDCCVDFDSCEDLRSVDCGPFPTTEGQCCFEITTEDVFCSVPGRPFGGCGAPTLADAVTRADWGAVVDIRVAGMSLRDRRARAQKWTRDALAEHASVASFAAFALQLMAVGAPAELVREAQRAALDEVEHARLGFAVASAYAGRPVGPGSFPVGAPQVAVTLAELAAATAEEGCINETLSTLMARDEMEATDDPAVRAILERIIEDETRHAELAWKTVTWAIATGGDEVRRAVRAVFARVRGVEQAHVREVIAPLADAVLAA